MDVRVVDLSILHSETEGTRRSGYLESIFILESSRNHKLV